MVGERQTVRERLLRRGFMLEWITLGWNVVAVVVLVITAVAARSVALAGFGLDSLVEIAEAEQQLKHCTERLEHHTEQVFTALHQM